MKLIKICEKLNKQPLKLTQNTEAIVFVDKDEYKISGIRYESGKFIGFESEKVNDKE